MKPARVIGAIEPHEQTLPTILTQRELAALLKVSPRTIRARRYPTVSPDGKPRYDLAEVRAFMAKKRSA